MPRKPFADFGLFAYQTSARRAPYWGIRLRVHGRLWQRQGFPSKSAAKATRDQIRTERHQGIFHPEQYRRQTPETVTVKALMDLVLDDYRRNQRRSLPSAQQLATFWTTLAGRKDAEMLTGAQLLTWADTWLATGSSPARVNRRMTFLLRGYRLAREQEPPLLTHRPRWAKLKEAAPRSGFVEPNQYQTLRAAFPRYAQIPITIGYWTGMRLGEILELRWSQVRFDRPGCVRLLLASTQTKIGLQRIVVMPGDLAATLKRWQQDTRRQYPDCPWVCHWRGRRIGPIEKLWKRTMATLGSEYQGLLFHDLRRSGVRNLVRAGVPEKIAMAISGHKTRAVFDRYNIVSEQDLAEAGQRVVRFLSMSPGMRSHKRQTKTVRPSSAKSAT